MKFKWIVGVTRWTVDGFVLRKGDEIEVKHVGYESFISFKQGRIEFEGKVPSHDIHVRCVRPEDVKYLR